MVYDSFVVLVLACTGRYLLFAYAGLQLARDRVNPALEEAAAVHGAGAFRQTAGILFPVMRPAIIALAASFWIKETMAGQGAYSRKAA